MGQGLCAASCSALKWGCRLGDPAPGLHVGDECEGWRGAGCRQLLCSMGLWSRSSCIQS